MSDLVDAGLLAEDSLCLETALDWPLDGGLTKSPVGPLEGGAESGADVSICMFV